MVRCSIGAVRLEIWFVRTKSARLLNFCSRNLMKIERFWHNNGSNLIWLPLDSTPVPLRRWSNYCRYLIFIIQLNRAVIISLNRLYILHQQSLIYCSLNYQCIKFAELVLPVTSVTKFNMIKCLGQCSKNDDVITHASWHPSRFFSGSIWFD